MPGFKTFTAAVLTSSDVNSYLMRQAVVQCTSSTRPGTTHDGMVIYETDTEKFQFYEAAGWRVMLQRAWDTRTPALTNWSNAGVNVQYYRSIGKSVLVSGYFTVSATTVIGNPIKCDLPFTPATHTDMHFVGSCFFFDASDGDYYPGSAFIYPPGGSVIQFISSYATTTASGVAGTAQIGNTPGFSLGGVSDGIYYQIEYEVS